MLVLRRNLHPALTKTKTDCEIGRHIVTTVDASYLTEDRGTWMVEDIFCERIFLTAGTRFTLTMKVREGYLVHACGLPQIMSETYVAVSACTITGMRLAPARDTYRLEPIYA